MSIWEKNEGRVMLEGRPSIDIHRGKPFSPRNFELLILNLCDRAAYILFSASVVLMLPVVVSSVTIKLSRPLRMVATDQLGFHELGWKSLMVRHSLVSVWNRPDGVDMRILGGLNG